MAAEILTDLVRRPPVRELTALYYGRVREDRRRYVGDRVAALHLLRRAAVIAASGVDPEGCCAPKEIRRWLDADELAPSVDEIVDAVLTVAGVSIIERHLRR